MCAEGSSRCKSLPESGKQHSLSRILRKPLPLKAGGMVAADGADVFVLTWAGIALWSRKIAWGQRMTLPQRMTLLPLFSLC